MAEYIHRDVSEIHEYQCSGNGKGYCQHDNQRILETFKLGGKDEVDKQDCQDEGKHQAGRTLAILFGVAGEGGAEGVVQRFFGYLVHFVQSLSDSLAIGKPGRDSGGHKTVVTV